VTTIRVPISSNQSRTSRGKRWHIRAYPSRFSFHPLNCFLHLLDLIIEACNVRGGFENAAGMRITDDLGLVRGKR
jgi:hypothetical protein